MKNNKIVNLQSLGATDIDSMVFQWKYPDDPGVDPGEELGEDPFVNVIKDPSFEIGPPHWVLVDNNSSIVTDISLTGSKSLRIVSDGAQGNHVVRQQSIAGITPGMEYSYSVMVKGDQLVGAGAGGKPLAILRWRNSSNILIAKEMYMWAPYGTYSWTKLQTHMQAPPDATMVDVIFRSWYGCLSGYSFWDDVELKPRDFSYRGNLTGTYDIIEASDKLRVLLSTEEINYSGGGYYFMESDGAFIEWNNVAGGTGGTRIISIRYSLEGNEQNWQIIINGTTRIIRPRATGQINSWATHDEKFTLNPGNNTVRILMNKVVSGANPRIDRLDVYEVATSGSTANSPVISPAGGSFNDVVEVSMQTTTPNSVIYYTLNGSTPNSGSLKYIAPFSLNQSATVKAITASPGMNNSEVTTVLFEIVLSGRAPYGGVPWAIPGRIKAVDYDLGGNNVAYRDNTPGNQGYADGGVYRNDDVDIWKDNNGVEGYYTGANAAGEWLEFTVNVAFTGEYRVDLRYTTNIDGQIHLELDRNDVSGAIEIPSTGSYENWTTISSTVSLTAGQHILRVFFDKRGTNLNWIEFTLLP
ncbi:MAG TPA: carbohydrate-binding protein [Paludibacter sp.]|nr:carbohydrate-binding protein [Paludibacter sp.]